MENYFKENDNFYYLTPGGNAPSIQCSISRAWIRKIHKKFKILQENYKYKLISSSSVYLSHIENNNIPEITYWPSGVNVDSIVVFGEASTLNPHLYITKYDK